MNFDRSSLVQLSMASSLYIHIPFCLKRCVYCNFVSGVYDPEKLSSYIDALQIETEKIPAETPLSTLFIGGGTPTVLPAEILHNLLLCLFDHFIFNDNFEATIESNPGTLSDEKLQIIISSGINRISLGVQSFNDKELTFLGRIHGSKQAEQAVTMARKAGFKNISIDLIYGIPGQSLNSWKHTLENTVRLNPYHISSYELTVEQGTALSRSALDRDEEEIIDMYDYAVDWLSSQGFIHYEISNFARPGYECRHNMNYWDRGDYYGAGLGAHSLIDNQRLRNTDDLKNYIRLITRNESPARVIDHISDEKALSEAIFLGLRKTGGITIETLAMRYKVNILSKYRKVIEDLQTAGLIIVSPSGCSDETNIILTRKGLLLSNEVFEKFV
ncbi:MAG: radical SAM family heme chaperone HemW [Nitrospiraceae bacterium]|nr:MAG: radical SAM family heme chaperone HemW [Nitrospiraceae bacterium]